MQVSPYFSQLSAGGPAAAAMPSVYFGAYAYAHDMSGAYHSRYGSLAAVDAQLIAKRERILQQVRRRPLAARWGQV